MLLFVRTSHREFASLSIHIFGLSGGKDKWGLASPLPTQGANWSSNEPSVSMFDELGSGRWTGTVSPGPSAALFAS